MYYKEFTINNDITENDIIKVYFSAKENFISDKRYGGRNIVEYADKIRQEHNNIMKESLIDYILDNILYTCLKKHERAIVHDYLLDLLIYNFERFKLLLSNSYRGSVRKIYYFNTLSDLDGKVKDVADLLSDLYPYCIEINERFHLITIFVSHNEDNEKVYSSINSFLKRIYNFLYFIGIEND